MEPCHGSLRFVLFTNRDAEVDASLGVGELCSIKQAAHEEAIKSNRRGLSSLRGQVLETLNLVDGLNSEVEDIKGGLSYAEGALEDLREDNSKLRGSVIRANERIDSSTDINKILARLNKKSPLTKALATPH